MSSPSSRQGNVHVLCTATPRGGLFLGDAHLDLVVVMPGTLPIEIDDGSGEVRIEADGSGSVRYAEVAGSVELP